MLNNPFYYFGAFYANFGSFSAINKASGKQQAYRAGEFPSCNVTEARRSRVRRGRMRSRGPWRGTHAQQRPVVWDARAAEACGVGRTRSRGPRGTHAQQRPVAWDACAAEARGAGCLPCSRRIAFVAPKMNAGFLGGTRRNHVAPCGRMCEPASRHCQKDVLRSRALEGPRSWAARRGAARDIEGRGRRLTRQRLHLEAEARGPGPRPVLPGTLQEGGRGRRALCPS